MSGIGGEGSPGGGLRPRILGIDEPAKRSLDLPALDNVERRADGVGCGMPHVDHPLPPVSQWTSVRYMIGKRMVLDQGEVRTYDAVAIVPAVEDVDASLPVACTGIAFSHSSGPSPARPTSPTKLPAASKSFTASYCPNQ